MSKGKVSVQKRAFTLDIKQYCRMYLGFGGENYMNEAKTKKHKNFGKLMICSELNLGNEAAAVLEFVTCQQILINSLLTYMR